MLSLATEPAKAALAFFFLMLRHTEPEVFKKIAHGESMGKAGSTLSEYLVRAADGKWVQRQAAKRRTKKTTPDSRALQRSLTLFIAHSLTQPPKAAAVADTY